MAASFQNIANVSYNYGDGNTYTARSNAVTGEIVDSLSLQKMVVNPNYYLSESMTYVITVKNSSDTAYNNLIVTDNLGSYTYNSRTVTPLDFIPDTSYISLNEADFTSINASQITDNSISFTIPTLAAGATAKILFTARANEKARLESGSTIINTSSLSQGGENADANAAVENITASVAATVSDRPRLEIAKCMSPEAIVAGGPVTYTFTVSNYGNTEASNIQISDQFPAEAAPSSIDSVTVNGASYTDYTYDGGVLSMPGTDSSQTLSLPAASYTQDTTTGEVTATPSVMTIVVIGVV